MMASMYSVLYSKRQATLNAAVDDVHNYQQASLSYIHTDMYTKCRLVRLHMYSRQL